MSDNSKTWTDRNKQIDEDWNSVFGDLLEKLCCNRSFKKDHCLNCQEDLDIYTIRCVTCNTILCGNCDQTIHGFQPLHDRWKTEKGKWTSLLPEEFVSHPIGTVSLKGIKILLHHLMITFQLFKILDVTVPIFLPTRCGNCLQENTLTVRPGTSNLIVVGITGESYEH